MENWAKAVEVVKGGLESVDAQWKTLDYHLGGIVDAHIVIVCVISLFLWSVFHKFVNDKVVLAFVPSKFRSIIEQKKKTDRDFAATCEGNGVAFVHAIIVSLLALYCILFDPIVGNNPWNSVTWPLIVAGWVMLGYFLWDIFLCLTHYRVYGATFLAHAALSFLGVGHTCHLLGDPLRVSSSSVQPVPGWFIAFFVGTEVSTPFLHIRYMLIQSRAFDTLYFQIMNVLFISTYCGYRLLLTPILCFYPYFGDFLGPRTFIGSMSKADCYFQMGFAGLWLALNLWWGILLMESQYKQYCRKSSVGKRSSDAPPTPPHKKFEGALMLDGPPSAGTRGARRRMKMAGMI